MDSKASYSEIAIGVCAYSLCSASLLLLNKILLTYYPFPSYVTSFQFLFATLTITLANMLGKVTISSFNRDILKAYGIYVVMFMFGIYSNMRALETSNVETVIVARACTPLMVSLLDYQFLGRQFPGTRSLLSLTTIVVGAFIYVYYDDTNNGDAAQSYLWAGIYLLIIAMEMTFGKHVKNSVETTLSESVYYTNCLASVPMFLWATLLQEYNKEFTPPDNYYGLMFLFLSSCVGVGIGYAGWNARNMISATSFTLVGVVNKFLTITVNVLIWDKHATAYGIFGLIICLAGATCYQQAPLRNEKKYKPVRTIIESTSESENTVIM